MPKSSSTSTVVRSLAVAALILFSAKAGAQQEAAADAAELAARYPKGSINSIEIADKALSDLARARAAINARYAQEEQACMPNFFATSCIDKAKEKQRLDLKRLRPIELESNKFKRQARAEKRDGEVADRQGKAEARRMEAAATLAEPSRSPDRESAPVKSARPGAPQTTEERVAEHEARLKAQQAREEAEAPKRAARAEAYERKVQASQKRQEEVARRKEEKEARRRSREQAGDRATPAAVARP